LKIQCCLIGAHKYFGKWAVATKWQKYQNRTEIWWPMSPHCEHTCSLPTQETQHMCRIFVCVGMFNLPIYDLKWLIRYPWNFWLQPNIFHCNRTLFITIECVLLQSTIVDCNHILFAAITDFALQSNNVHCNRVIFIYFFDCNQTMFIVIKYVLLQSNMFCDKICFLFFYSFQLTIFV